MLPYFSSFRTGAAHTAPVSFCFERGQHLLPPFLFVSNRAACAALFLFISNGGSVCYPLFSSLTAGGGAGREGTNAPLPWLVQKSVRWHATHTPPHLNSFIPPTDGEVRGVDNRAASYHTPPSFPCIYHPNDGVFLLQQSLQGKGKPTPHHCFGGRIPPAASTTTTGQCAIYTPPCSISFTPPPLLGGFPAVMTMTTRQCATYTTLVFFLFPPGTDEDNGVA